MSVGKKSPSLNKWVTGVELDPASTSTTTGAGRWDKLCAERRAVPWNFFFGGGAGAAASGSKLLAVIALLVAFLSEASLLLPLPLSLPLGESPTSDWGFPAAQTNPLHQLQCADATSLTTLANARRTAISLGHVPRRHVLYGRVRLRRTRNNQHLLGILYSTHPTLSLCPSLCLGLCPTLTAGHKGAYRNVEKHGPPL